MGSEALKPGGITIAVKYPTTSIFFVLDITGTLVKI
jgi:hypothetical protein